MFPLEDGWCVRAIKLHIRPCVVIMMMIMMMIMGREAPLNTPLVMSMAYSFNLFMAVFLALLSACFDICKCVSPCDWKVIPQMGSPAEDFSVLWNCLLLCLWVPNMFEKSTYWAAKTEPEETVSKPHTQPNWLCCHFQLSSGTFWNRKFVFIAHCRFCQLLKPKNVT